MRVMLYHLSLHAVHTQSIASSMAEQSKSGPDADMTAPPSQAEVATLEMLNAFRKTHPFIAVVELGVFCAASGARRTASEIGRLCKVHESKKIDALLDLLVIEKLLVRPQADDGSFLYENSEGADALFSDKTSSSYKAPISSLLEQFDYKDCKSQRMALKWVHPSPWPMAQCGIRSLPSHYGFCIQYRSVFFWLVSLL